MVSVLQQHRMRGWKALQDGRRQDRVSELDGYDDGIGGEPRSVHIPEPSESHRGVLSRIRGSQLLGLWWECPIALITPAGRSRVKGA